MTRVGFVGLGSQGAPMARRIIDAGFTTTLWARREATLVPFAASGAAIASTPAELGAESDVLCVCVVDDAGVDSVLRGDEGALGAMSPGSTVVVHSTVHPATCTTLQADYPSLHVVDAPVSGGGLKAETGELLVMIGGPGDAVERCRPIFATYGNPVVHVGPLGSGQVAKLVNNALFTAQLGLAAGAFELAESCGLDRSALAAILAAGSARSYGTDLVAGLGFTLDALAEAAGPLLAKDVGIFVEHAGIDGGSPLLAAADDALARMHITRHKEGSQP